MSEPGEFFTDRHLGGYVVGGDPATVYPALWDWTIDDLGVTSMVDVGCGDGVAVRHFRDRGVRVLGIDGVEQDDPDIVTHDFTTGPYPPGDEHGLVDGWTWIAAGGDLCWSCEFVEHVEEKYVDNFLQTFGGCDMLMMTHADVGQPGWHHVNCQPALYWIDRIERDTDHRFDTDLTARAREIARATNPHPLNHFARSGLVFRVPS